MSDKTLKYFDSTEKWFYVPVQAPTLTTLFYHNSENLIPFILRNGIQLTKDYPKALKLHWLYLTVLKTNAVNFYID